MVLMLLWLVMIQQKVHNWVRGFCRLAIFSEHRRAIIKREDLTKKSTIERFSVFDKGGIVD